LIEFIKKCNWKNFQKDDVGKKNFKQFTMKKERCD
jgi:hypothetical protein